MIVRTVIPVNTRIRDLQYSMCKSHSMAEGGLGTEISFLLSVHIIIYWRQLKNSGCRLTLSRYIGLCILKFITDTFPIWDIEMCSNR